jgi:hypothetical protein
MKMRGTFAANAAALFVMAAVAAVSFVPTASAITYTTSGFSLEHLGDTMATGYDYFSGDGVSQAPINSDTIVLNSLSFTAGINATVPQYYPDKYSIVETLSVGGGAPQTITIPFTLDINYSDTLTIVGTTFSYYTGSSLWQFVVKGFTIGPNPGGTMTASLNAQVSQAPLPAALPLFASGLGAMGLFAWWRRRKVAAITA